MKVLVVDDEPLARDRLIRFLQDNTSIEVAVTAHNGIEALEYAATGGFDVVLLDIRMPGMSGIEVAAKLRSLPEPPAVIFCTAYDEYAIEAFTVKAESYLLKPVQRTSLDDALARCSKLTRAQITALADHINLPVVVVQNGRETERIPLADIYFFRADQKYVSVFCVNGERVCDESLKHIEQRFPEQVLRIHRNTLVMKSKIERLTRDNESGFWLKIQGVDERLTVSRRHAKEIKQHFENIRHM